MNIGILCGHALPNLLQQPEDITVHTPYGDVIVSTASLGNHQVFVVQRHGEKANLPPHKVNHRGNIQALASCHVSCVYSVGTVGSMKKTIQPGEFVLPHDFIDVTKSRAQTFFDDTRVHVDMTEPFCPSLRQVLLQSCKKMKGVHVHDKAVYLVTEGPRLETAAEIALYAPVADVVGMTLVPEVVLAREKCLCFASICLVCNMAAGLQHQLTADEITAVYRTSASVLAQVLKTAIASLKDERSCQCPRDVSKARL